MGQEHFIKTITHSWRVDEKIMKQSKQILGKKHSCKLLRRKKRRDFFRLEHAKFFPASRGPFSFVFAELTGGTKRDLCHGSKLPLIQPPSMVVDGGFRNACSLYCLLTVT